MIRQLFKRFMRHLRDETGAVAVEFVLVFPVAATMMVMTLEMGFITLRQTLLERGLDMAVREVRLGTGSAPQHDQIKDLVCANSIFIKYCNDNLRLEMVPDDVRNFGGLDPVPDCTDKSVEARPVRQFTPGQSNELMLMRACLTFDPLFPDALLARTISKDKSAQTVITAVTAFVQEPR